MYLPELKMKGDRKYKDTNCGKLYKKEKKAELKDKDSILDRDLNSGL